MNNDISERSITPPLNVKKNYCKKYYFGALKLNQLIIIRLVNKYTLPILAGCLMVVFNYTGDRLNFGLAKEQAIQEGLKVWFMGRLVILIAFSRGACPCNQLYGG